MIMHWLTYQVASAPVWCWLLTLVVLPIINELVQRSQKITAQSLIQAVGNAVKASPLYSIPVIKQIANVLATPSPPKIQQPDAAAGEIKMPTWLVFLGVGALGLIIACGAVGKKIATDFAACTAGSVPSDVQPLSPQIEAILQGGNQDWQLSLEQMGVRFGGDVIKCGVLAVYSNLKAEIPPHGQPEPMTLVALGRAETWLKQHP